LNLWQRDCSALPDIHQRVCLQVVASAQVESGEEPVPATQVVLDYPATQVVFDYSNVVIKKEPCSPQVDSGMDHIDLAEEEFCTPQVGAMPVCKPQQSQPQTGHALLCVSAMVSAPPVLSSYCEW
jgi:hypothetical protein